MIILTYHGPKIHLIVIINLRDSLALTKAREEREALMTLVHLTEIMIGLELTVKSIEVIEIPFASTRSQSGRI